MKVLRYDEPLKASIVEGKDPVIKPNQSLAKSILCNVSAGTEMAFYRGTAPQLNFKDRGDGLWEKAPNNLTYPMQSNDPGCWWMGYACVAKVVETGSEVEDLKIGDLVFTFQAHREYQIVGSGDCKLPKTMNPEHASFTALATVCFNGFLDSRIKLLDNVVIIGMGTIGQMFVQMAKMAGAFVIAVDYLDSRLELASKLGADATINPSSDGDLAENVIKILGKPADSVVEVTGNSKALPDAVRCVCKDGQVTVISFYQQPPDTFEMGREFHHNRVTIRSSQIGSIAPDLSHQYDKPRREKAVLELIEKMNVAPLISHRCTFDDYPEVLAMIEKNPEQCQSVIINY